MNDQLKAAKLEKAKREKARRTAAKAPQKGLSTMLWENFVGDNDDTTQNFGEKVGSFLNKAGESATFGLVGDEASAAVAAAIPGGRNYDQQLAHERGQEEIFERENPGLALTADVGGALAAPVGALGALGKGAGLLKRMAASGAATAGMSGTFGFMEGEGGAQARLDDAVADAGTGGLIGSAIPAVGSGVQRVADNRALNELFKNALENAPATDELRRAGQKAYQAIDDAGVSINPDKVQQSLADIRGNLRSEGAAFTGADKVLPASRAILEAADDVGKGANSVPFKELDVFRRYMGNAAGANLANKADSRNATNALTSLDDFIQKLGPDDVDAGDVEALQTMLPKARDLWSKMSRSQMIDDAMEAAQNYRSGEASGIRAQFQRILGNKKLNRGFSEAEKKLMRRVVNGTLPEQMLNYLGGGLGMLSQTVLGGAVGGIPGMAVGAGTALGSRKLAESIVSRNAEKVRAVVANGGLPQLPKASAVQQLLTEKLLRQGTAGGLN